MGAAVSCAGFQRWWQTFLALRLKSGRVMDDAGILLNRPPLSHPTAKTNMKSNENSKAKSAETQGRNAKAKLDQSGLNTRVKGHLSSTAKRQQAKRDSKNP